ncbi:MAG: hypothetical protein JRI53_09480 [Deltaproteobacteria bacterium]|nr:hypothetical protein [Deltaproteobacteria bacterium]MBW2181803.1 hypothetical protein [Deltaproteobacteria bacterium]
MNVNPLEWSYQGWRLFFLISAIWNLLGCIEGTLLPAKNMLRYYGVETDDSHTLFLNRSFWGAVLVFGIGYLIIAYDPGKHLGIVAMGIIGKILVSANWFYLYGTGRAKAPALFAAVGDSIFTFFFIVYLYSGVRIP